MSPPNGILSEIEKRQKRKKIEDRRREKKKKKDRHYIDSNLPYHPTHNTLNSSHSAARSLRLSNGGAKFARN